MCPCPQFNAIKQTKLELLLYLIYETRPSNVKEICWQSEAAVAAIQSHSASQPGRRPQLGISRGGG